MTLVEEEKKKETALIAYLNGEGTRFPPKVPLHFDGMKKSTDVYQFRELPKLPQAIRAIFTACISHDKTDFLKALKGTDQWENDSFIIALFVRFAKKLVENLSFEILTPILASSLLEMIKERGVKIKRIWEG